MPRTLSLRAGTVGAVLVAVLGMTVGVVTTASNSQAGQSSEKGFHVMKLTGRPLHRETLDLGAPGPSLGDKTVFSIELLRDGVPVGHDGGVCINVIMVPERIIECYVTMLLPEGLITAQVLKNEPMPPPPFYAAITGGTGAYAGASGQIYIEPTSPTTHNFTLYFERK